MENNVGINVPKSYSNKQDINKSVPTEQSINEVPNSINKVKRKTIRGVLKSDDSSSNK